jgi:hypothetical protein
MNTENNLIKMKQNLIEVENNYIFYCNNCNNEFDHVISFLPMPGLTEYYTWCCCLFT